MTTPKSTMFDRLLKQSILTLCKEAIVFDDNLVIDGIICLTCDGGPQHVIQVHELFQKIGNKSPNATMPASGASSVEIRQSTQKPNVQSVNNAALEVSNNASTSRESEGINRVSDTDVNAAATADEPTQLDAGSVYDEHKQNDDYTDNSPGTFNQCVYDKATQNDSDSPANNDRRWQLYHEPPLRHNVDNNTRNNGTGNKTPSSGPATEAGTANTSNPELRTLITKTALNNDNCASKIGKDNAKESGTPRVTGTTAAAASMGGQTRRKTSTGRANTPIMKQKKKVFTPNKLFKSKGSFTCNLCDAKFTDFDDFNVHCDLVHHTYFCKYCGKSFKSKSNRERHAGYHIGTRSYTCDECGDSFFRVGDLKCHTTSKHDPKLYTCGVCHEAFAYIKQLEKHLTAYPEHMRQ